MDEQTLIEMVLFFIKKTNKPKIQTEAKKPQTPGCRSRIDRNEEYFSRYVNFENVIGQIIFKKTKSNVVGIVGKGMSNMFI